MVWLIPWKPDGAGKWNSSKLNGCKCHPAASQKVLLHATKGTSASSEHEILPAPSWEGSSHPTGLISQIKINQHHLTGVPRSNQRGFRRATCTSLVNWANTFFLGEQQKSLQVRLHQQLEHLINVCSAKSPAPEMKARAGWWHWHASDQDLPSERLLLCVRTPNQWSPEAGRAGMR